MAIRERKGRAKPFQCYWNNPYTGKRESVSFETREEAEKEDSLVKHRLRFERESFRPEEKHLGKANEVTLEYAYLLYLREKQFSRHNLAAQVSGMRLIMQRLGQFELSAINFDALSRIMADMSRTDIKPVTVRKRMAYLRAILRWCAAKDLCEMPKFPHLPTANYESLVPPTPEELEAIMAVAPPHIQRVIILGAQLGARVGPSELFSLTWQDVDLVQGIMRIHGSKKNLKSSWREVPIRERLLPVLTRWAIEDKEVGAIHLVNFRGNPVHSIKRAWAKSLRKAGITRRIRPYDLRHAFATELIAAGADVGTVAKLMGHTSPNMVLAHYQYVMDRQKRAAVESLPDFAYVPKTCAQKKKGEACYS